MKGYRLALAATLLALLRLGIAQPSSATISQIERLQVGVKASALNSRSLVPQIDTRLTVKPPSPRNPAEPPDLTGLLNNLPVGQVVDADRIELGQKWPAIGMTGWYPPDPDIAVGQSHIVAVVNSSIAFFDKSGVKQFQQTAGTFFSGLGAGSFIFDPKCTYDRVHNRFVVVFLEEDDASQVSKILFAISDDGDPNGTWYRYRIEAKLVLSGFGYWMDYPGLGYNKDAYVVCGNMFGFSNGFAGVQFLVVPSASVLSGGAASIVSLRDSSGASAQIADNVDPANGFVFGVSHLNSSALRTYAVRDPGTLTPTVLFASVTVPSSSSPSGPAPSTSGRTLDTIDGRVFNALFRGGRLVTAHTASASGINYARWYEVNTGTWPTSGAPTLVQSGNVSSGSLHYFTPAISKNSLGDISCIFTGSNSTTTANFTIAGRAQGDPAGAMGSPLVMETSAGSNYTLGRWGDYFGVDVDPVNDTTFWGIAMTVASDNNWRTSIFSWNVSTGGNTAPSVVITQPANNSSFNLGASVTFGGTSTDAQSGDLSTGIVWSSNLQGNLGTGASVTRSDLIAGTHVITASSTDPGNLTGTANISVTIVNPGSAPAAPGNFTAVKLQSLVARLTWTDLSSNEDFFDFERELKQGKNWINTTSFSVGANATATNNTVGSAGSYRYRIRSRNAYGTSAWSGWVQVRL